MRDIPKRRHELLPHKPTVALGQTAGRELLCAPKSGGAQCEHQLPEPYGQSWECSGTLKVEGALVCAQAQRHEGFPLPHLIFLVCHRLHVVSSRLLTLTNKITDHLPAIKAYGRKCQIAYFVWKMVLQKWQLEDVQAAVENLDSSHNAHVFSVVFNPVYLTWTNSPALDKETFLSWNSKYSDASESLEH